MSAVGDPICSLAASQPLIKQLESPLWLALSGITLAVGLMNKSVGLLKVPGSVWVAIGAAGLGLGLYQKLRCP